MSAPLSESPPLVVDLDGAECPGPTLNLGRTQTQGRHLPTHRWGNVGSKPISLLRKPGPCTRRTYRRDKGRTVDTSAHGRKGVSGPHPEPEPHRRRECRGPGGPDPVRRHRVRPEPESSGTLSHIGPSEGPPPQEPSMKQGTRDSGETGTETRPTGVPGVFSGQGLGRKSQNKNRSPRLSPRLGLYLQGQRHTQNPSSFSSTPHPETSHFSSKRSSLHPSVPTRCGPRRDRATRGS